MNGYQDKDGNQEETIYIQIHYQDMNGGNQKMEMKDFMVPNRWIIYIHMMVQQEMHLKTLEELETIILLFIMRNCRQLVIILDFSIKIIKETMYNQNKIIKILRIKVLNGMTIYKVNLRKYFKISRNNKKSWIKYTNKKKKIILMNLYKLICKMSFQNFKINILVMKTKNLTKKEREENQLLMMINKNKTNFSNKTSKKLQMHTINLKNKIKYSCNKAKKIFLMKTIQMMLLLISNQILDIIIVTPDSGMRLSTRKLWSQKNK